MKRSLSALVVVLALAGAACGGGDKKPVATPEAPTEKPTAAATPQAAARTPMATKASS